MKRPRYIWLGFTVCLAVVLAAMGWVSLTALRLDGAQADARRLAAWEEQVRLALWRMDTVLAPFVAQESVRPYFAYSPFLPVDRAYSRMFNDRDGGEMLIASPLLVSDSPSIRVYFQFEPDGSLTSPQVPEERNKRLAVPAHVTEKEARKAAAALASVGALVDRRQLLARLPENTPEPVEMIISPLMPQTDEQRMANRVRQFELQKLGRGAVEFGQRSQAIANSTSVMALNNFDNLLLPSTDVSGVVMTPLWIDGRLILARRISVAGREYVQGCLLDWPAIKQSLLEAIEDLLPEADLEPVTEDPTEEEARMLAALPLRLIPGQPPGNGAAAASPAPDAPAAVSPIVLSLIVAWAWVLLAAVAVAGLLAGVIRLSERRASFVTAVTHELRTPLTTFQMYAEMLAEGMVSDKEQEKVYLRTLRAEAVRLTHMVENVLSYARLERGRSDGRIETISSDRLIEPLVERLAGRAEQAGMELIVETNGTLCENPVRINVAAAEQILFNLVDNACKYASAAENKRIHLSVESRGEVTELRLRDHGPGISTAARRRLFRSFSKTAEEAARSAPGIGLGLALSRRLARDMAGDLRLDEEVTDGACFVLTLPSGGSVGGVSDGDCPQQP